MAGVVPGAPGGPLEGQNAGLIAVCHVGPQGQGERLLKPIKDFGPPAVDLIAPTSYKAQQTMFDGGSAPGGRNYWSSNFVLDLGDEIVDILVDSAGNLHGEGTMLLVEHLGGAVARVGEHDTAFAHRSAQYNVSVLASWTDPADDEANVAWTRATSGRVREFSTGGGYLNYISDFSSGNHLRGVYETNMDRLIEIKRKYDPTNFFSSNHNIKP
jgi:FAD/FMN-containing dehydrogenase